MSFLSGVEFPRSGVDSGEGGSFVLVHCWLMFTYVLE